MAIFLYWAGEGGELTSVAATFFGSLEEFTLVAALRGLRRPRHLFPILRAATRESVMILMIITGAAMFGSMLLELSIPEAVAVMVDMDMDRWSLILWINIVLLALGCFLPPVAVILMTVPLLIPLVVDAGFDPVWLAVMMTLNMQIGLITPLVGLNLQVVHALAPAVPRDSVLRGAWPFMLCMAAGIVLFCLYPQLATALPDGLMGPAG
jgi:TRAP-type C4-dicarboxylate transport system permease large subunit